jgi:hypothetical protein
MRRQRNQSDSLKVTVRRPCRLVGSNTWMPPRACPTTFTKPMGSPRGIVPWQKRRTPPRPRKRLLRPERKAVPSRGKARLPCPLSPRVLPTQLPVALLRRKRNKPSRPRRKETPRWNTNAATWVDRLLPRRWNNRRSLPDSSNNNNLDGACPRTLAGDPEETSLRSSSSSKTGRRCLLVILAAIRRSVLLNSSSSSLRWIRLPAENGRLVMLALVERVVRPWTTDLPKDADRIPVRRGLKLCNSQAGAPVPVPWIVPPKSRRLSHPKDPNSPWGSRHRTTPIAFRRLHSSKEARRVQGDLPRLACRRNHPVVISFNAHRRAAILHRSSNCNKHLCNSSSKRLRSPTNLVEITPINRLTSETLTLHSNTVRVLLLVVRTRTIRTVNIRSTDSIKDMDGSSLRPTSSFLRLRQRLSRER